jgi:RNA polymerase sigma factor (sigma-70 family)
VTDTGNEYLVKVTIRNNLILRQMKKLGIKSQSELARLAGLTPTAVGLLVGMKRRPLHALSGEWLDSAFALSAALHMEPEELWTEKQRGMALASNSREVSMSEDAVMQLASGDRLEHNVIASKLVANALTTLRPREQDIIHRRFFEGETLEEIGNQQGVTKEVIRQLEAKALRKLKHPSRSRPLRQLIQGDYQ